MKVSHLWLQEWVNLPLTKEALASLLTMAGLEVEGIHPVAGQFEGVVVAEITRVLPHPNADKLSLCEVRTDNHSYSVVCGASNVYAGIKVALAQLGAKLPNGMIIKPTKLRGELSEGMLCSATELGIDDNAEGIMHLPPEAPLGLDLRSYLSLNDAVFEFNLTPNRGDCLSVLGIARETAALLNSPLQPLPETIESTTLPETVSIAVDAPNACPVYWGRVVRDIDPQASTPLWMQERLRRAGIRPVYPVVDVTNYVMLELGQPMHAFDVNTLEGQLTVRFAQEHENLVLLNDQEVKLNQNVLVIANRKQPIAIAGVMGGRMSAIQPTTTHVFLESAFFDPQTVAGVARQYGLKTDASHRFERGVDPSLARIALERASALLIQIAGGQLGPLSSVESKSFFPARNAVLFSPATVKKITGVLISEEEMKTFLEKIGVKVEIEASTPQTSWRLTPPYHRFDLNIEVDMVEEIIRLHGYDNLPAEVMTKPLRVGARQLTDNLNTHISKILCARGYYEAINYSFVDPTLQEILYPHLAALRLLNPISEELSQMRLSLWPGLIAAMVYNVHRQQLGIKLFETGVLFREQGEIPAIGGLLSGISGKNWAEKNHAYDFYDMKGDLETVFVSLHLNDVMFEAALHPALHPTRSAKLTYGGKEAGWCGVLHPRIIEALELSTDVIVFELYSNILSDKQRSRYQPVSKYPKIRRDLSLLVSQEITVAQIENVIRSVIKTDRLKAFDVFDVYRGKTIPDGKKSVGIALTMQDDTLTMTDEQVSVLIDATIRKLNLELAITLREQP